MRRTAGFILLALLGGCAQKSQVVPPAGLLCGPGSSATECTAGRCHLLAAEPLSTPAKVTEIPVPPELAEDAAGDIMCHVELPATVPTGDVSLAIDQIAPPADGSVLFKHFEPGHDESIHASGAIGVTVAGYIDESGDYGATVDPGAWQIQGLRADEALQSNDLPSLLRNLATGAHGAAFFDGQHFYLSNGPRILIYDGLPSTPSTKPSCQRTAFSSRLSLRATRTLSA